MNVVHRAVYTLSCKASGLTPKPVLARYFGKLKSKFVPDLTVNELFFKAVNAEGSLKIIKTWSYFSDWLMY
jgi:hypothetical protein